MNEHEKLIKELETLKETHRKIDKKILMLESEATISCAFELQRLKKQKLLIKDRIIEIENIIYPDVIA